jgi:hypothetical protein
MCGSTALHSAYTTLLIPVTSTHPQLTHQCAQMCSSAILRCCTQTALLASALSQLQELDARGNPCTAEHKYFENTVAR